MKDIIAIDLGGTSAKLALVSFEGDLLDKWTIETDNSQGGSRILPQLIQSIKDHLASRGQTINDFIGIGMGTPGTISPEGRVHGAYNLNWVNPEPVKASMEQGLSLPCHLANDADVAALGEFWQGAGKGLSDMVMLTLGTGVGGGIISQSRLIEGGSGSAGEIGHICVDSTNNYLCTCGKNGCLEAVASATGIVNLLNHAAQTYQGSSSLLQKFKTGQFVDAEIIINAAKTDDDLACQVFDQFTNYLALACSHLANILNPQQIVIGGGVSHAGQFLLEAIDRAYLPLVFEPIREKTILSLAQLGNDAGVLGAAYLLLLKERGI